MNGEIEMVGKTDLGHEELRNVNELFKDVSKKLKNVFVKEYGRKLPKEILKVLRKHTPVDTGETSKSWLSSLNNEGFIIENDRGDIIEFLLKGVAPHKIVPTNKSVLRIELPGSVLFTKFVNHPGYPSQMNEKTIVNEIIDEIIKITDDIIRKSVLDKWK